MYRYTPALLLLCCSSIASTPITSALDFSDLIDSYNGDTDIFRPFYSHAISLSSRYLVVGQILNVTCSLLPENIENGLTSREIYFRPPKWKECFPPANVTLINSTTAMLTFPVTIESAGSYQCTVDPSCRTHSIGSSDNLIVDYRPEPVVNFSCQAFDREKFEFTCQWDNPISYKYPADVLVKYCFTQIFPKTDERLYCSSTNTTSFTRTSWSLPFVTYSIFITVKNCKVPSVIASHTYTVDFTSLVRPDHVTSFSVSPSPHCFSFKWTNSTCKGYTCISRIYISTSHDSPEEGEQIIADDLNGPSFEKCNFSANTLYTFCIQLHPSKDVSGFWSKPVCKDGKTPITAPSESPQITPGSYAFADDSSLASGMRKITLFWKPLEHTKQNGALDGYHITVNGKTQNASSDSFSTTVDLDCQIKNVISISAFNSNGSSPSASQWPLEPLSLQLKVPDYIKRSFAANISGDKVSVVWDPRNSTDSYRKFIYWCKGISSNQNCEEELSWSEIQNQHQKMTLPIDSRKAFMYLYGISLQNISSKASSGIFWTSCLLQNSVEVDKPKFVDAVPSDGKIVVKWDSEDCSYKTNVRIIGYKLEWCFKEQCKGHFVRDPERNFTITDVLPDHTYNGTIKAVSQTKESNALHWSTKTLKDQTQSLDHITIVIPILLVIFIMPICIGSFVFYKWRGRVVHKWFEENGDKLLKLPDYLEYIPAEKPNENLPLNNSSCENSNDDASVSTVESLPTPKHSSTSSLSKSSQSSSSFDDQGSGILLIKQKNRKWLPKWIHKSSLETEPIYYIVNETGSKSIDKLNSPPVNMGGIVPFSDTSTANFSPPQGSSLGEANQASATNSDYASMSITVHKNDWGLKGNDDHSQYLPSTRIPTNISISEGDNRTPNSNDNPEYIKTAPSYEDEYSSRLGIDGIQTPFENLTVPTQVIQNVGTHGRTNDDYIKEMPPINTKSNGKMYDDNVKGLVPIPFRNFQKQESKATSNDNEYVGRMCVEDIDVLSRHGSANSTETFSSCISSEYVTMPPKLDGYDRQPCSKNEHERKVEIESTHSDYVTRQLSDNGMHYVRNDNPQYEPSTSSTRILTNNSVSEQDNRTLQSNDDPEHIRTMPSFYNVNTSRKDTDGIPIPKENLRILTQGTENFSTYGRTNDDHIRQMPPINTRYNGILYDGNLTGIVTSPICNYTEDDSMATSNNNENVRRVCASEHVRVPVNCDEYISWHCNGNDHEGKVENSPDKVLTQLSDNPVHCVENGPGKCDRYAEVPVVVEVEGIPTNDDEYVRTSGACSPDGMSQNGRGNRNDLPRVESDNLGELFSDATAHDDVFPSPDEVTDMSPSANVVV